MHTVCGFLFKLGPFVIIRTLQTPERCSLKTLLPQRNTDISEIGLNSWRVRKIGKELEKLIIVWIIGSVEKPRNGDVEILPWYYYRAICDNENRRWWEIVLLLALVYTYGVPKLVSISQVIMQMKNFHLSSQFLFSVRCIWWALFKILD